MALYFIDDSDYLEHYGILGMKWGVRKDGKHPMTKRQAKKAIRSAKRTHRKKTHLWDGSTGANVSKVDKALENSLKSDNRLKDAISRRDSVEKRIAEAEADINIAEVTKDQLTRLQKDPNASQDYQKLREQAKRASASLDSLWQDYEKADSDYSRRYSEIYSSYIESYKQAAVQDIGIHDIEAGVRMLEDYGLVRKATGGRVGGLRDAS